VCVCAVIGYSSVDGNTVVNLSCIAITRVCCFVKHFSFEIKTGEITLLDLIAACYGQPRHTRSYERECQQRRLDNRLMI